MQDPDPIKRLKDLTVRGYAVFNSYTGNENENPWKGAWKNFADAQHKASREVINFTTGKANLSDAADKLDSLEAAVYVLETMFGPSL